MDLITDDAIKWLDERDITKPFCVLIWNKAPHRDWMPAIKYLNALEHLNHDTIVYQLSDPPADIFLVSLNRKY